MSVYCYSDGVYVVDVGMLFKTLPKMDNILMLRKRRPPQFTGFVENRYRHEHVMITN